MEKRPLNITHALITKKFLFLLFAMVFCCAAQETDSADILYKKGYEHSLHSQYHTAIILYEDAIKKDPTHPSVQKKLGEAYLATGNFAKGWHYLEDRWQPRKDTKKCRDHVQTYGSLSGRIFFLMQDWDYGDTFMMIRYAKNLKDRGAHVIIAVKKELIPILSLCPYIDRVCSFESLADNQPPFHFSTLITSLPWVLDIDNETKIPTNPYLYAEPTLIDSWHQKIAASAPTYKIGICWQGSRLNPTYLPRHIPLPIMAQLASLEDVTIYSLQKETATTLPILTKNKVIDFGSDMDTAHGRFMDTAAIIKNLDLVITSDTSIAHLAGALGAPVWLLLSTAPEWRWMLDRNDSPWYPTMRIFRQTTPGDWQSVIDLVREELKKKVKTKIDTR